MQVSTVMSYHIPHAFKNTSKVATFLTVAAIITLVDGRAVRTLCRVKTSEGIAEGS